MVPLGARRPLRELLDACHYFERTTKRRVTFEWARLHLTITRPRRAGRARVRPLRPRPRPLRGGPPRRSQAAIQGKNDTAQTAHELGKLLQESPLNNAHVNIIPLNPTRAYQGAAGGKKALQTFISVLGSYGVSATPRMRRGLDIDAGCGQLATDVAGKGAVASAGMAAPAV